MSVTFTRKKYVYESKAVYKKTEIEKVKLTCSRETYNVLQKLYQADPDTLQHEAVYLLCLDRANNVCVSKQISKGGFSSCIMDIKSIFKEVLLSGLSGMIISHNHPSGNLKPSTQDNNVTEKLKAAAKTLDISFLDHIIYTENGYFSYADEGLV
jgi:DNA repair protein RadC